jgi:hypothetical protein
MGENVIMEAEIEAARRRMREALRRVNQDWTCFGAVEKTNSERLESARAAMARLGLAEGRGFVGSVAASILTGR